jgi:hypothetical protein
MHAKPGYPQPSSGLGLGITKGPTFEKISLVPSGALRSAGSRWKSLAAPLDISIAQPGLPGANKSSVDHSCPFLAL